MRLLHLHARQLSLVFITALISCTLAHEHEENVEFCGLVLRDLEGYLASSFCSSFAAIEDVTSFVPMSADTATATQVPPAVEANSVSDSSKNNFKDIH
jgi:hypothetical protein